MNNSIKKLFLVNSEIESFKKTYPAFYLDLVKILNCCTDGFMLEKGFSLKIRNLFRILLEDDCDKIKINDADYMLFKKQSNELMINHLYCYYDFVELVKKHVRSGYNCIGYNTFVRLLYGEPPISICNNTSGVRQAVIASKLLIEFTEMNNDVLNYLNEIHAMLLKKVYPETCFSNISHLI